MAIVPPNFRVIASPGPPYTPRRSAERDGAVDDLVVLATLFVISVLPLAGAVAHLGNWTPGELGLGAAAALFSGRELCASAAAALRARRRS